MKIKRIVDGVEHEFELTREERFDTYCEQQHIWDMDYVAIEYGEEVEQMCKTKAEMDAFIEDVAFEMRRQVDKYNVSEWYALDEAFKKVTSQREEDGKQHDARS